jgi:hypothetical protein
MANARIQKFWSEAMNEPVAMGGAVWSYGFLLGRLGGRDMGLFAATNKKPAPGLPDARGLDMSEQMQLWDAMGEGDMPVINALMKKADAYTR